MFKAFKSVVDKAAAAATGEAAGDNRAPGHGHEQEGQSRPQQQAPLDRPTCYALELLLLLLGLYWMQNDMGDFVEDGRSAVETAVCYGFEFWL